MTEVADVLEGRRQWAISCTDVLAGLAHLPDNSVHCCITSPPYFGLRDYGTATWEGGDPACTHKVRPPGSGLGSIGIDGGRHTQGHQQEGYRGACGRCGAVRVDRQIGLEPTLSAYLEKMAAVFAEVKRVLRPDGTLWLNIGDGYANDPGNGRGGENCNGGVPHRSATSKLGLGYKRKDLLGVPWRLAFALQADGWYLRSDIVWSKPNPMPESVTDRPTRSHEYVFLLSKSAKYWYDADAIREPHTETSWSVKGAIGGVVKATSNPIERSGDIVQGRALTPGERFYNPAGRNRRTVWTIATEAFPESHFATYPTKLVEPCVLAGSPPKCCPACGAPWTRVVETTYVPHGPSAKAQRKTTYGDRSSGDLVQGRFRPQQMEHGRASRVDTTTGWSPGCAHGLDPIGGVVLDPFVGSGTTVLVALRHGRRGIGLEISPAYAEMARTRIEQDAPLFNAEPAPADAAPAQLGLWQEAPADKQAGHGRRHAGFNARWKAQHEGEAAG